MKKKILLVDPGPTFHQFRVKKNKKIKTIKKRRHQKNYHPAHEHESCATH